MRRLPRQPYSMEVRRFVAGAAADADHTRSQLLGRRITQAIGEIHIQLIAPWELDTATEIDPATEIDATAEIDPTAKVDAAAEIDPTAKIDPAAEVDPAAKVDPEREAAHIPTRANLPQLQCSPVIRAREGGLPAGSIEVDVERFVQPDRDDRRVRVVEEPINRCGDRRIVEPGHRQGWARLPIAVTRRGLETEGFRR